MNTGGEEFRELEASLSGAGRVCGRLKRISFVCSIVFLVACILLLTLMILDAATKGFDAYKFRGMLYVVTYSAVILWLLFVAYRSFSDVVNGESPFTLKQVGRFRNAAFLLLTLAIIDAFLSTSFIYGFNAGGIDVAALGNFGTDQNQIRINATVVFFAIILLGVSSLFRYGVLLQRLTDETD